MQTAQGASSQDNSITTPFTKEETKKILKLCAKEFYVVICDDEKKQQEVVKTVIGNKFPDRQVDDLCKHLRSLFLKYQLLESHRKPKWEFFSLIKDLIHGIVKSEFKENAVIVKDSDIKNQSSGSNVERLMPSVSTVSVKKSIKKRKGEIPCSTPTKKQKPSFNEEFVDQRIEQILDQYNESINSRLRSFNDKIVNVMEQLTELKEQQIRCLKTMDDFKFLLTNVNAGQKVNDDSMMQLKNVYNSLQETLDEIQVKLEFISDKLTK